MHSSRTIDLESYLKISLHNLTVTSRTAARGIIDTSSANQCIPESCKLVFSSHELGSIPYLCKEEFETLHLNQDQLLDLQMSNRKAMALNFSRLVLLSKTEIGQLVVNNFKNCMRYAYNLSLNSAIFNNESDIKNFLIDLSSILGKDIINTDYLFRRHDSDKFHVYTRVVDLNDALDNFCTEFLYHFNKLIQVANTTDNLNKAIDFAAWVEYRVNFTDHFFSDGCAKISAVIGYFIFMAANIPAEKLPLFTKEAYRMPDLPITRRGSNADREAAELKKCLIQYRKEFNDHAYNKIYQSNQLGLFAGKDGNHTNTLQAQDETLKYT